MRKKSSATLLYFTLTYLITCIPMLSKAQEVKKIKILNSDIIKYDKALAKGAQRLIGNVKFEHANSIMNCDSAYFYSKKKLVYAFGNVHIIKDDTIHLYGNSVIYQGKSKLARVRHNVKLIDKNTVLTTQYLDFDLNKNIGYYYNKGTIVNIDDTLKSDQGYYFSNNKQFFFKDNVIIINPKYKIYSDTLQYNTVTRTAFMFGPTDIISDDNYIYCENGWYNTNTNICQFNQNAFLTNKSQIIKGDSLYYERNTGHGRAFLNVNIIDTLNNIILKGNFAEYFEHPDSSNLTDSTVFIQVTGNDSMYIHADTLRSIIDTNGKRLIKGYHRAKLFRYNIQGMCDSLIYAAYDSTIQLYTEPVIWSDINQLSADKIIIHTNQGDIDFVEMKINSFIISEEDTAHYNQIKGKKMIGYFKNNELHIIDVNGNGETIYYPKNNNEIIGLNKVISSDLTIYFENKSPKDIKFRTKPNANLTPLSFPEALDNKLKNFNWQAEYRPNKINDIFIWKK